MNIISGFRPAPRFGSMEKVEQIAARRAEAEARAHFEELTRTVGDAYQANRLEIAELMNSTVYESPFGTLSGLELLQAVKDTGAISKYSFLKDKLPDADDKIGKALDKMDQLGLLAAFWADRSVGDLGNYVLQRVKYGQGL